MSFDITISRIDGMEMRQLECFLACCDQRSFTAAAKSLNLVQSAVSTSIAKLERELGAQLFDRTPAGLELTEAGRAALAPAKRTLQARREIVDAVDSTRDEVRGEVVVGNLMNVATFDIAAVIADVFERYPEVTMQMRQSTTGVSGNLAGVRDGSLDLALVGGVEPVAPGLTLHPIASESLVLCTHPDDPLARRRFRTSDLDGVRFVDFPPGWGTRAIVDELIPNRNTVIEVADQLFALELVSKRFGVTIVPRSVAEPVPGVAIVERAGTPIPWRLFVARHAQRTPSNAARAVIDAIRSSAQHRR